MPNQLFDIIYIESALFPPVVCHVLARRVEAIDRAHALLWWLRKELALTVDPVEMFDDTIEQRVSCGCEIEIGFRTERLGRLDRWRKGESAIAVADISSEPCEQHDWGAEQSRVWDGMLAAYIHDPKRPDQFERS